MCSVCLCVKTILSSPLIVTQQAQQAAANVFAEQCYATDGVFRPFGIEKFAANKGREQQSDELDFGFVPCCDAPCQNKGNQQLPF